jgi:hypothetical protein
VFVGCFSNGYINPQAYGYCCRFHLREGLSNPSERVCTNFYSRWSKDTTLNRGEGVERFPIALDEVSERSISQLKILASGTGLLLVCQATPANSSTLYLNVEAYKGLIGLSLPTAYL